MEIECELFAGNTLYLVRHGDSTLIGHGVSWRSTLSKGSRGNTSSLLLFCEAFYNFEKDEQSY